jgi:hypothetical protein
MVAPLSQGMRDFLGTCDSVKMLLELFHETLCAVGCKKRVDIEKDIVHL